MKKIGLVFSLVLFFSVSFQVNAQWFWQNPLPLGNTLYAVDFVDTNIGWIAGSYGTILKTTDGGNNWIIQNSDSDFVFKSIYFFDDQNGIAVGGNYSDQHGIVLRTSDGGNTWIPLNLSINDILNSIFFVNSNVGWIVGGQIPIILKTTDGGVSWVAQSSPQVWLLTSVFFLDENNGWITSGYGEILKTTDGGNTWVKRIVNTGVHLYSICFFNQNVGFAGATFFLYKTTNSGISWYDDGHPYGQISSLCFTDSQVGWSAGESGLIHKTTDQGISWETQFSNSGNQLWDLHFDDQNIGWAVGNNGIILHTTNGGVTFIEGENNFTQAKEFLLEQNYPNPFNPSTTIKFALPVKTNLSLSVYNTLGEKVAEIFNGELEEGYHEMKFNASGLSSGVYFYKIESENYTATKKLILLK